MIDFEAANIARDARLRWRVLRLLDVFKPVSPTGLQIKDALESAAGKDRLEDEQHLIKLLTDLCNGGCALIVDTRTLRREELTLGFMNCSITHKGTSFVARCSPPDPLIDDGRIVK